MIKFFRKIRQNLLNQGETTKYFKYAIGEIVLVVIGILIALQINNWNEEKKNLQKENIFLEGILNDITQQKKLCNNQIDYETIKEKWSLKAIETSKSSSIENQLDSLYKDVQSLKQRLTFAVFNPTYEELKSTGALRLIKNKNLKSDIVLFYQNLEKRAEIITNNNHNIDNIYKTYVVSNALGFFYNNKGKIEVYWKHKPSQKLQLVNNLQVRKNLTLSNLFRAKDVLIEASKLELKIKEYLKND